MYSFKNDYSEICHPEILKFLLENTKEQFEPYGKDRYSIETQDIIRKITNSSADVHFLSGGTQTNLVLISSVLKRHEAVICCDTGHINIHEAGSIESRGNKLLQCPNVDGKLTVSAIEEIVESHPDEHMVKPKLVFISQATELGTIYSKTELKRLKETCEKHDLYLFIDGARLGASLESKEADFSLEDIAKYSDAFYIGGTKNGALLGEALVLVNDHFKRNFRYNIKQNGAMLAKGAVVGMMFYKLFTDNLFFTLAEHANKLADLIQDEIVSKGYKLFVKSTTNQIFPIFTNELIEKLKKDFDFHVQGKINEKESYIRLVTSWATDEKEVKKLIKQL